jgi:hypothetical protein
MELFQYQFVHHESYFKSPGTELSALQLETNS